MCCNSWGCKELDMTEWQNCGGMGGNGRIPQESPLWNVGGREIQEGSDLCIHTANLLCCTAKTNTALQSNYIPIFFLNSYKDEHGHNLVSLEETVLIYRV